MKIVSYGGGTNSTALLIECVKRSISVDLILFADTGGERPETYKYLKSFSKWCVDNGLPEITRVQAQNINGTYHTLEAYCLQAKQLPSIAYGFKSCSQKHKIAPQDKFLNNWQPAKDEWKAGNRIVKFIGYDADEPHRVRDFSNEKYNLQFPLIEWGMGREECVASIASVGLEQPNKSSCFFCPSMRVDEIKQLQRDHPNLAARALHMESNAELTNIKGLGRSFAWRDVMSQGDMFDDTPVPELACGCYDG